MSLGRVNPSASAKLNYPPSIPISVIFLTSLKKLCVIIEFTYEEFNKKTLGHRPLTYNNSY